MFIPEFVFMKTLPDSCLFHINNKLGIDLLEFNILNIAWNAPAATSKFAPVNSISAVLNNNPPGNTAVLVSINIELFTRVSGYKFKVLNNRITLILFINNVDLGSGNSALNLVINIPQTCMFALAKKGFAYSSYLNSLQEFFGMGNIKKTTCGKFVSKNQSAVFFIKLYITKGAYRKDNLRILAI